MNTFSRRTGWARRLVIAAAVAVGFVLLPLCVAAGGDAGAGRSGTPEEIDVQLKSGEVIEGATYQVDTRFKVLTLTLAGGRTHSVSFSEVAIITSDGANVTPSILGPGYLGEPVQEPSAAPAPAGDPGQVGATAVPDGGAVAPGSEESREAAPVAKMTEPGGQDAWLGEQEEAYRESQSPAWRVAVRAAGNFSVPFGDYYEGVRSGVGYEGDLLFAITNDVGIRLSVSKSGMRWEEDALWFVSLDPDVAILDQSFGLSAVRYTISGMGYWPLGKEQEREDCSMLYAYGGLGSIQHEITADLTVHDESTEETTSLSIDDTQSYFITTLGGGLVKSISSGFGVDLSMNLDQVWLDSESYAWVVDVRAGLVVFF